MTQRHRTLGGPVTAFVTDCGNAIADVIDGMFATIEPLAHAAQEILHERHSEGAPVTSGDLTPLQQVACDALDRRPELDSAGVAFDPGALADRTLHLDWWHRVRGAGYAPLVLDLDPASPDRYDYPALEWYAGTIRSGGRFACGPTVDETIAHNYILTLTRPLVVCDRIVGVVGTDVGMARFEHLVIRPLRRIAADAVLVNGERRIIASNCSAWTTGEKLPTHPTADRNEWQIVVPVTPDLGWSLAVRRPGRAAPHDALMPSPDTR